jgi:hypothetical protein
MISQYLVSRNKNFFFFFLEWKCTILKGTNWNTNKFHNNSNYIAKSIMLTDSLMIHLSGGSYNREDECRLLSIRHPHPTIVIVAILLITLFNRHTLTWI